MNRKKTANVFSAKKEITKSDAKKLAPLSRFWEKQKLSDNGVVRMEGVVIGVALTLIAAFIGLSF